jgi:hypothetical protein
MPPEIRMQIFRHLAPDDAVPFAKHFILKKKHHKLSMQRDGSAPSTALFQVCRTIHEEYSDVFYGDQPFAVRMYNLPDGKPRIAMCNGDKRMCFWRPKQLAPEYFARIRKFNIYIMFTVEPYNSASRDPTTRTMAPEKLEELLVAERTQLVSLIETFVWRVHAPLHTVNIYIEVQGSCAHRGNLAEMHLGLDNKAREHCAALLQPLRGLRAHRSVVIECWRRPKRHALTIRDISNLGAGVKRWYDPYGEADAERERLSEMVRAAEEEILGRGRGSPEWH